MQQSLKAASLLVDGVQSRSWSLAVIQPVFDANIKITLSIFKSIFSNLLGKIFVSNSTNRQHTTTNIHPAAGLRPPMMRAWVVIPRRTQFKLGTSHSFLIAFTTDYAIADINNKITMWHYYVIVISARMIASNCYKYAVLIAKYKIGKK